MTEKQWRIIDKEFISYTGGYAYVISNGDCGFCVWERKEDVQKVCDKLNELTSCIESYKNKSDMCEQYQKDVTNTLIKHHNYAQNQCGRNLDDIMVYSSYRLLVDTIRLIANEIGVDLNG